MTSMNSRKKNRPINDHYHFKFSVCCWDEKHEHSSLSGLGHPQSIIERLGPAVMVVRDWLLRVGGRLSHN